MEKTVEEKVQTKTGKLKPKNLKDLSVFYESNRLNEQFYSKFGKPVPSFADNMKKKSKLDLEKGQENAFIKDTKKLAELIHSKLMGITNTL